MPSRWPHAVAAFLATAALSFAFPARAIDGEVLIDQAAVNAGGITPGDAPGFPATLSRRGKYKLTGNLAVPTNQNGIEVTASDVTVDLNGFAILGAPGFGSPTCLHATPEGPAVSSLTVKNGAIAGCNYGILGGALTIVENTRVNRNGELGMELGAGSRVRDSTISGNDRGVSCGAGCLVAHTVIGNNVLSGSPAHGHGLELASPGLVLGNVIASNSGFGIKALSGLAGVIGYGHNTITGNGGGAQISDPANLMVGLHPNACSPTCP